MVSWPANSGMTIEKATLYNNGRTVALSTSKLRENKAGFMLLSYHTLGIPVFAPEADLLSFLADDAPL
jgi:hypothetical protein